MQIARADAKLTPLARGDAGATAEVTDLTRRRDTLGRHLAEVDTGTDHDWPSIEARIDADL